MPRKKGMPVAPAATGAAEKEGESLLLTIARTVGSTLAAAEKKAGEAADDLMTFSKAAQRHALGAARNVQTTVNKTVSGLVAGGKKSAKKPRPRKRQARKSR